MSFNWANYKTLAEHLHNNPDPAIDEAYYRSAISRTYYAAFHITKQKMVDKYGYHDPTANAHKELLDFLGEKKDNNSHFEQAWNLLRNLGNQRKSADYDDVYDYQGQDLARSSAIAIEYCKKVLEAVSILRRGRRRGLSTS